MDRLAVAEKSSNTYYGWKNRINAALERALNFCFENEKYKAAMVVLVLTIIDFCMLFLNKQTPLVSDDLHYAFIDNIYTNENGLDTIPTGPRVASLGDIFESQYSLYFTWGGRVVGLGVAQFFLMYDKSVFNIANTAAYVLLLIIISIHIQGKFSRFPGLIILSNAVLFAFTPAFGQDFLWVTGACIYLWGAVLSFSYLLAFRFQLEQETPVIAGGMASIMYGLWGIICAWTNENMAITMVVLAVLFNIYTYLHRGKCYKWSIFATIGMIIGAVLLIGAPGNFMRVEYSNVTDNLWLNLLKNFGYITIEFFAPNFLLVPLAIALLCYILRKENKNDPVLWFNVIGLFVSMYSMMVAPEYVDRAKLASLILGIIICGRFLTTMSMNSLHAKKLWAVTIIAAIALSSMEYIYAGTDIVAYNELHKTRMEMVSKGKAEGDLDLILPEEIPLTRFCAASRSNNMLNNPDWPWNQAFARYYGLHTVRLESNDIRIHRSVHIMKNN